MLRRILAAMLVAGLAEVPTTAQAVKTAASAEEMVPAPGYTPRAGDRVHLIADPTPGFARPSLFEDYANSSEDDDPDRLRAMLEKGELVDLEGKAPVQVIRNLAPSDAREPGRRYPVEVRLLGGSRVGESWFVPESSVVRLVPKVIHPPMAVGSLAAIAGTGTTLYPRWDGLESVGHSSNTATDGSLRLDKGVKVVILEKRGEAVRIRVHSGSKLTGRVGVVDQAGLRPIEPPARPAPDKPAPGR